MTSYVTQKCILFSYREAVVIGEIILDSIEIKILCQIDNSLLGTKFVNCDCMYPPMYICFVLMKR